MPLNPIAAGLRNPTKSALKIQLSIPAGAALDEVADQLLAAGMREMEEPPAFLGGRPKASVSEEGAESGSEAEDGDAATEDDTGADGSEGDEEPKAKRSSRKG